jgi:hypothetical protein
MKRAVRELQHVRAMLDGKLAGLGITDAGTPGPNRAVVDQSVQGLGDVWLLERYARRVVQQQHVDAALQALLRAMGRRAQVLGVEALDGRSLRAIRPHLGEHDGLGVRGQQATQPGLHRAVGVSIGGVESGHAETERSLDHPVLLGLFDGAVAVARQPPRTEAQLGDFDARFAEGAKAHDGRYSTRPNDQ